MRLFIVSDILPYRRVLIALALLLVCLLLSACTVKDDPEAMFDNYLYRLGNSLQLDTFDDIDFREQVEYALAGLPRYPKGDLLRYEITRETISLLAFLRLSRCELQRHIGARNSSLGRVMGSTQQLYYDITFIVLAKRCIALLEHDGVDVPDDQDLVRLRSVLQMKQGDLSERFWNATFASAEFKTLFSLGAKPLTHSQAKETIDTLNDALLTLIKFNEQLPALLVAESPVDVSYLEQSYALIGASKRLGQLRLSMRLISVYLSFADQLLQQRIAHKPLCYQRSPSRQFTIVNTVFTRYYIGEVQPYLSKIHQQSRKLLLSLEQLQAPQQTTTAFANFWQAVYLSEAGEWQHFQDAIAVHTQHWQSLLRQCGRLP